MATQSFNISTDDGDGVATKQGQGEPWHVMTPGGDFRFYGSIREVKKEIKERTESPVTFTAPMKPLTKNQAKIRRQNDGAFERVRRARKAGLLKPREEG